MSIVATSRSSWYFIADVIIMLSNATVGDAASYLLIFSLSFRSSAQYPALTLPLILFTKTVKDYSASNLSCFVSFLEYTGKKVSILCGCVNYFITAFSPLSPKTFKHVFQFYCCIKTIPIIWSVTFLSGIGVTLCSWQEGFILIVPYLYPLSYKLGV